jgi:hypothetical protein
LIWFSQAFFAPVCLWLSAYAETETERYLATTNSDNFRLCDGTPEPIIKFAAVCLSGSPLKLQLGALDTVCLVNFGPGPCPLDTSSMEYSYVAMYSDSYWLFGAVIIIIIIGFCFTFCRIRSSEPSFMVC